MRELKNKIICLVGESGSGKTALYDLLRNEGYGVVDSYTTRPMRKPNELGHTFVTKEGFDAIRGDLAAYTEFDNHEYGTTFEQLKNSEFYIIDPAGVDYLSGKVGRDKFIVVYVSCNETERLKRMTRERGLQDAYTRIEHDRKKFKEFHYLEDWEYIINNEYQQELFSNFYFLERLVRKVCNVEV